MAESEKKGKFNWQFCRVEQIYFCGNAIYNEHNFERSLTMLSKTEKRMTEGSLQMKFNARLGSNEASLIKKRTLHPKWAGFLCFVFLHT